MNELLHDLLLIIVVWLLWTYWPMWEISRQPGSLIKKKRSGGSGKESAEAKVFPGLTRKPDCLLCEKELHARTSTPAPPPLMGSKRGARSSIDTSRQFCPQEECVYYGWLGRGNIIANGHPGGGLWRQCHCKACGCYFLETCGTVFFGKRQAVPVLLFVLAALVEGLAPGSCFRPTASGCVFLSIVTRPQTISQQTLGPVAAGAIKAQQTFSSLASSPETEKSLSGRDRKTNHRY